DFFKASLLKDYVQCASSYNFDYVWLLNSYTPYETRYSNRVIKQYAEHYNGVVLDYGSSPVKNPFWKQYDTPIVRSLHYMGDDGDFEAKLSEITMFSDKPLFLFITLYPWAEKGLAKIDDLIKSSCSNYEFIDLSEFFYLLNMTETEYHYFEDSRRSVATISYYEEYRHDIMWNLSWTLLLTISPLLVWFGGLKFKRRKKTNQEHNTELYSLLFCGTATTLYFTSIIWVIFQNYWQWSAMATIPIFAFVYPLVRSKSNYHQKNFIILAPLLIGSSALLAINFPAAILLGAFGYFIVVKNELSYILKSLPVSISFAIIISFFVWTVWIFIPFIMIMAITGYELQKNKTEDLKNIEDNTRNNNSSKKSVKLTSNLKRPRKIKFGFVAKDMLSTFIPALIMSLAIIPAFYLDMHIINLKMDYRGDILLIMSIIIPILSYPIGRYLTRFYNIIKFTFPPTWLLIWLSPTPIITILILVLIQSQIFTLLIILFDREVIKPLKPHRRADFAKNFVALPIIVGLFIVIPPMAYSVYGVTLPTILLYLLYYKPLFYFLFSLLLLAGILILDKEAKKPQ
ncbi:MAG: hypothetical protein KAJ51_10775, partial [Thermoplasmata archaeon]|nr:hypothetical protein [Thermoplasmata archaeon]